MKLRTAIVSVIVYLGLGLLIALMFYGYQLDVGKQNAIDGGVTAIAEIKYIISGNDMGGSPSDFNVMYEYIDENGIIYREQIYMSYDLLEEAKAQIGRKIEIYIDGKGNSIPVGHTRYVPTCLIAAIVFIAIAVGYTVLMIYSVVITERAIARGRYLQAAREAAEAAGVKVPTDEEILKGTKYERKPKKRRKSRIPKHPKKLPYDPARYANPPPSPKTSKRKYK